MPAEKYLDKPPGPEVEYTELACCCLLPGGVIVRLVQWTPLHIKDKGWLKTGSSPIPITGYYCNKCGITYMKHVIAERISKL